MQNFDIDFLARGFNLDKNGSVKIKIDDETEVSGWWAYGNLVKLGTNLFNFSFDNLDLIIAPLSLIISILSELSKLFLLE